MKDLIQHLAQDLKYSCRILLKSPLVSAVVVLSLALGIGINATLFTVLNAVLLNPLPVDDPESLVSVYTVDQKFVDGPRGSHHPTSFPNFEDMRDRTGQVFSHLTAYVTIPLALMTEDGPEEVTGQAVTAGFFDMLGMRPAAGRFFTVEENGHNRAQPVVVLSHRLWRDRFAATPSIAGQVVTLGGQPFEVVGVAPKGFTGPNLERTPDLWVPMMMRQQLFSGPLSLYHGERRALMFWLLGRLQSEVSPDQATAALDGVALQLAEEFPDVNRDRTLTLVPLLTSNFRPDQRERFARAGGILLLVVAAVLLLVCANVGHLLMVRAEQRRTEISLRLALGSTVGSLSRQLVLESLLLAAVGGGLGLALAHWGRDILWSLRPPMLLNAQPDLSFDGRVLAFTAVLALGTALLASLGPLLRVAQIPLSTVLRDARPIAGSSRLWTARGFLVVFQIALSLVALIVSGLFATSLDKAQAVDTGFAVDRLAALSYNLGTLDVDPQQGAIFHRRVLETAQGLAQVKTAALATVRPLNAQFSGFLRTVVPDGLDPRDPQNGQLITTNFISAGYFDAFEIPIVQGRPFSGQDRLAEDGETTHRVAIVNATMAQALWPGQDPLGRRLFVRGVEGLVEVVGVARDSKYNSVGESPIPFLYLSLEQNHTGQAHLFVHAHGDPRQALEAARAAVQPLEPSLPLTYLATMEEEKASSLWALRLAAMLLGIFGAVATLLAALGIFGVMSYGVRLRRQELGIRLALGAERPGVVAMIVRQGMTLVAVGILVGWGMTALLSRLFSSLLFDMRAVDGVTFMITAVLLATVALISNLVPAGQAVLRRPMQALRD